MSITTQYITDEQGNKISIILPIADYQSLLEDLEDLADVAERHHEPTQSFAEVLQELGYELPN